MTLRDQVWDAVLKQILKTGYFRISDLPFDEGQRHTVRRTLRVMEEQEWLSRENNRAATWRMGELAELHLNVSADKIEAAKS
jgi:predicted transcriptional regulator